MVSTVKERLDKGELTPSSSVAFIYRTNAQSRALEEACVQNNVPYVIFGSATSFYKRQEIKDCLCFLRWMYNGRDQGSMIRCFRTPAKGLGDVAIQKFTDYCDHVTDFYKSNHPNSRFPTPFDVLIAFSGSESQTVIDGAPEPGDFLPTRPLKLFTQFSGQMRMIRDAAFEKPIVDVLSMVIDDLDLFPHLNKLSKTDAEFEERKSNVRELQNAAERYSNAGACLLRSEMEDPFAEDQSPLGSFLDDVALVTNMADEAEASSEDRFVVSLMTIHASKGMEFDTVFVVGNEEGTFPSSQSIQEDRDNKPIALEEECRLCYVAMTRAKTDLVLTWRKTVPFFTKTGIKWVDKDRSRFLNALTGTKTNPSEDGTAEPTSSSRKSPRMPAYRQPKANASRGGVPDWRKRYDRAPRVIPEPKVKYEGTASVFKQRASGPSVRAVVKPSGSAKPARSPPARPATPARRASSPVSKDQDLEVRRVPRAGAPGTTPWVKTNGSQHQASSAKDSTQTRQAPKVTHSEPLRQAPRKQPGHHVNSSPTEQSARTPPRSDKPSFDIERTFSGDDQRSPVSKQSALPLNGSRSPTDSPRSQTRSPTVSPRSQSGAASETAASSGRGGVPASSSPSKPKEKFDSTWFYPVGSTVEHKVLGRGKVVTPPSEMEVCVEFGNGKSRVFDVMGSDIVPIF